MLAVFKLCFILPAEELQMKGTVVMLLILVYLLAAFHEYEWSLSNKPLK